MRCRIEDMLIQLETKQKGILGRFKRLLKLFVPGFCIGFQSAAFAAKDRKMEC